MRWAVAPAFLTIVGLVSAQQPDGGQRRAIADIEGHGGKVERDARAPGRPVTGVVIAAGSTNLETWLSPAAAFPALRTLTARSLGLRDRALTPLETMARLETLDLGRNEIGDDGLEHVGCLKGLRVLDLGGNPITDHGLSHLAGLAGLETLDLSRTRVTDAGLSRLESLKQLRSLKLHGTAVTDEGVARLRRALPDAVIEKSRPDS